MHALLIFFMKGSVNLRYIQEERAIRLRWNYQTYRWEWYRRQAQLKLEKKEEEKKKEIEDTKNGSIFARIISEADYEL